MTYSLSAALFVLAIAGFSWLTGQAAQAKLGLQDGESGPDACLLSFMVGFGLLICVLFVLATAQLLRPLPVGAALGLVTVISLAYLWKSAGGWRNIFGPTPSRPRPVGMLLVLALFLLLSLRAFAPALEWDELAYHLPVARDFARSGGLTVFENLRYPLNAWNLHLVWAGALMFGSEAAPHLVNAGLAVLVTLGIYRFWARTRVRRYIWSSTTAGGPARRRRRRRPVPSTGPASPGRAGNAARRAGPDGWTPARSHRRHVPCPRPPNGLRAKDCKTIRAWHLSLRPKARRRTSSS